MADKKKLHFKGRLPIGTVLGQGESMNPDRQFLCGHTPEDCDCDPTEEEERIADEKEAAQDRLWAESEEE